MEAKAEGERGCEGGIKQMVGGSCVSSSLETVKSMLLILLPLIKILAVHKTSLVSYLQSIILLSSVNQIDIFDEYSCNLLNVYGGLYAARGAHQSKTHQTKQQKTINDDLEVQSS